MTELPAQPAPRRKGLALATGGVLLAAVAVGGGVWGYQAFYGQGDQAAQALPTEGLLGYVALDLSPNGDQLLSARSTLKKFPGLAEELDLDSKDDLRKVVFEKVQEESGGCTDLDYDTDIEPWLGDRMAFAFVDGGKGEEPTPVLVFQTTDASKATKAAPDIADCLDAKGTAEADRTSHAVSGDWLVLAEGQGEAEDVVSGAEDGSLADDEKFQKWTEAAGDPGMLTAYAAPLAAQRITEVAGDAPDLPADVKKMVEEFDGAGLVARFRDGAVELEAATNPTAAAMKHVEAAGGLMGSLPDTTVGALAVGFADDWMDTFLEDFGPALEEEAGMSLEQVEAEMKKAAGIDFDDIETLVGDAVALAVDSGINSEAIQQFDFTGVPVGLKIKGDTKAIEKVLDTLRDTAAKQGMPRGFIVSETAGDHVVISLSPDYADKLAEEEGLGKKAAFDEIVPDADKSASTLFVDFDADSWLDKLLSSFDAPKDVVDNVKPLSGFGITSWNEDGVTHAKVRLTTD